MPTVRYTTVNGQILAEKQGGTRNFYGADPLGSTSVIYDSSGNISTTYAYWPYGEVRSLGGGVSTPFKFCGTWGYYVDAFDAGDRSTPTRTYVRARFYRDKLAKWQTVDPLWPVERNYPYLSEVVVDADPTGLGPKCRLVLNCREFNIVNELILIRTCTFSLEVKRNNKWQTIKSFDAGSGGGGGCTTSSGGIPVAGCSLHQGDPVPPGNYLMHRDEFITKETFGSDNRAWGDGAVIMPLKPDPRDEGRIRRDNPGREMHPGSFNIHGGAAYKGYRSGGCITLTNEDVKALKKLLKSIAVV